MTIKLNYVITYLYMYYAGFWGFGVLGFFFNIEGGILNIGGFFEGFLEAPETGALQPPWALLRPFAGFVQPPGRKN